MRGYDTGPVITAQVTVTMTVVMITATVVMVVVMVVSCRTAAMVVIMETCMVGMIIDRHRHRLVLGPSTMGRAGRPQSNYRFTF